VLELSPESVNPGYQGPEPALIDLLLEPSNLAVREDPRRAPPDAPEPGHRAAHGLSEHSTSAGPARGLSGSVWPGFDQVVSWLVSSGKSSNRMLVIEWSLDTEPTGLPGESGALPYSVPHLCYARRPETLPKNLHVDGQPGTWPVSSIMSGGSQGLGSQGYALQFRLATRRTITTAPNLFAAKLFRSANLTQPYRISCQFRRGSCWLRFAIYHVRHCVEVHVFFRVSRSQAKLPAWAVGQTRGGR
jgi:hypothetical protein